MFIYKFFCNILVLKSSLTIVRLVIGIFSWVVGGVTKEFDIERFVN